ncbi:response regulator [Marinoscillum furvescens]|uniref:Stage II sporulation protein E n=1 Tax=Marinoscillum furvescens DSM 4134 TaxID=1122208 RepID=A0A3D9L9N5_MARFU|nr:response regulator [Marinoscillum furvescens]REE02177.1 stage II sporulation protein E [Marinoscillum furvescens DSM 4134]
MEEIQDSPEISRVKKSKKYSLLYVDDETTNLRVFKSNFRKFFNVHTCDNPLEAIDILKENDIQVIVTDQRMPEMTGTELLEKILPDYPDMIKIILTGFTDIEAIKDGINRCGIYKYITKPWNFDEMKGVLDRAMETYQQSQDSEEHMKELEVTNVELEQRVRERTEELKNINKRLIDSIRYAGLLQQSMLPNERYLSRILADHFVMYRSKYLFSEEFIWTTSLNFRSEDYTVVAVIEFDGKGIVGSLKTLIADSILNDLIQDRKIFHSGDIIKELTQELDAAGSKELQCDLKVSVALFDNNAQTLQFSGINQDMIIFNGNEMVVLEGETEENIDDLMADRIAIEPNATYYMFSNGYYNQENQDGVKFSQEKFEEMLKSVQDKPLAEQYKFLNQTVDDWIGESGLTDDISIIGFRL